MASYPGEGRAARGRGLALGLATADGATADRISAAAFERGLLLETCGPGGGVVKLLPPLTDSHGDLDLALDILDASVKSALVTHVGAHRDARSVSDAAGHTGLKERRTMTQYEGRVVVTGGGFVGSHLCERLLREGFAVVCVDDFSTGSVRNVEPLDRDSGFQLLETDVSTGLDIGGAVDAVLHLACPASPGDYMRRPLETRVGSTGTQHALDLAGRKDASFLLASTSEVYGATPRSTSSRRATGAR